MIKRSQDFTLTLDLTKAICAHTLPTDLFINEFTAYTSNKGNLVIQAVIKRNGEAYNFSTEVIYAGGYNIQCLHYRYLTSTNLPKSNDSSEAEMIKKAIQKLTKQQKSEAYILSLTKRMETNRIAWLLNITVEADEVREILFKAGKLYHGVYSDHHKENFGSKEAYATWLIETNASIIELWYEENVFQKRNYQTQLQQSILIEETKALKF